MTLTLSLLIIVGCLVVALLCCIGLLIVLGLLFPDAEWLARLNCWVLGERP